MRRDLHFASEPIEEGWVLTDQAAKQDFDRNFAPDRGLGRAMDRGHPAAADLFEDRVLPDLGASRGRPVYLGCSKPDWISPVSGVYTSPSPLYRPLLPHLVWKGSVRFPPPQEVAPGSLRDRRFRRGGR